MIRPSTAFARAGGAVTTARLRLRGNMLPIVQNAIAAVAAWSLAVALLPDPRLAFAAIAAVIAVGVTTGERTGRALQLVGGVVLGITVASLLISVIGTGAWQIGVLVVLAMATATAVGGRRVAGRRVRRVGGPARRARPRQRRRVHRGPDPRGRDRRRRRARSQLVPVPARPGAGPGRAAQSMFVELGRALERIAHALEVRDPAPPSARWWTRARSTT